MVCVSLSLLLVCIDRLACEVSGSNVLDFKIKEICCGSF